MNKFVHNRFGITGWLFMLGFVISSFVLMNISDVFARIYKEEMDIGKFSYSEKYWIKPVDSENFYLRAADLVPSIVEAMQTVDCNSSFYDLPINIGHQIDNNFVELVINCCDEQKLISNKNKSIEVDFPKDSNALVIGESVTAIEKNNGELYINIGDINAPVADVLNNSSPAKIDNSIYAFWDCADEEFHEYLIARITERLSDLTLQVHFYGDNQIDAEVRKFSNAMSELELYCEPMETYLGLGYEGKDAKNLWYRAYNFILLPICIVFAIFTCFSTSYIWVLSRTKELSIRKAFGYSDVQILSLVIKDEMLLAIPAVFASLIIEFVLCIFTNTLDFFDMLFIVKFAFVCAGMLIITIFCAVNQTKSINKISSAAALKND